MSEAMKIQVQCPRCSTRQRHETTAEDVVAGPIIVRCYQCRVKIRAKASGEWAELRERVIGLLRKLNDAGVTIP